MEPASATTTKVLASLISMIGILPMHLIHFHHPDAGLYTPRMAAYLVVDIKRIRNEALYAEYKQQVSPGLMDAGGRYLARGGPIEVLEGDWRPNRLILVRFESSEAARTWWGSKEYAPLRDARQASTDGNMVLVEGIEESEAL
jgi:uncharacterized protein (DUF1330 family)